MCTVRSSICWSPSSVFQLNQILATALWNSFRGNTCMFIKIVGNEAILLSIRTVARKSSIGGFTL